MPLLLFWVDRAIEVRARIYWYDGLIMRELPRKEIRQKAIELNRAGLKWHFHILPPDCKFNVKTLYAFVLEGPDKERYVYYSEEVVSDLGKELAPLAHKAEVLYIETTSANYSPSKIIQKIVDRAQELNQKKIKWHHHVTSPGCQYHKGGEDFILIFEDPITGKSLESYSEEEPINDLKQIEPLFYSQR